MFNKPIMKSTEPDDECSPEFELNLMEPFPDGDGEPTLGTCIFENNKLPEWMSKDYYGCGVLDVKLRDVLEEFLNNFWGHSGGEATHHVINILREYALKIEQELMKRRDAHE